MDILNNKYSVRILSAVFSLTVLAVCVTTLHFMKARYDKKIIPVYRKAVYFVPDTFDPPYILSTSEHAISHLLYDGLFSVNKFMEYEPTLVDSWNISADGKTYRFKIKSNVLFHDGSRLSIKDVMASLNRLKTEKTPVSAVYRRMSFVRDVGDHMIEIVLDAPYPPFIAMLAAPVAKIVKHIPDRPYPLGTGPFYYEKINLISGKRVLSLQRNKDYYGKNKVYIQKMEIWEVDEVSAVRMAKSGFIHDTANWIAKSGLVDEEDRAVQSTSPAAQTWLLSFNTTKLLLKDLSFRKCFVQNFPKREFLSRFLPDHDPAVSYLPNTLLGSTFNLSDQSDKQVSCRFNMPIKLALDYPMALDEGDKICLFIKQKYNVIGLDLECRPQPFDRLLQHIMDKTADISLFAMTLDLPDVEYFLNTFESTSTFNLSNYKSPQIDVLLAQGRQNIDKVERANIYQSINRILYDQYVTLNISHPKHIFYRHRCLKGVVVDIIGDQYIDYKNVYLNPSCYAGGDFLNENELAILNF